MGILGRLFGEKPEQALARYRYLLRTAPPEAIEQAHAEAFAQLTPEQRTQALQQLSREVPPSERAGTASQTDPHALARLERALGGRGISMGGMFAGSLLSSIAGAFIGTAIAHQLLGGFHDPGTGGDEMASAPESSQEDADADFDGGGDDLGGDFGDV